jgi:RimJ/RimL family protein N-acetyltransferase
MQLDIETTRLRIRQLEIGDVESCHQLYMDIGWADASLSDAENRALRQSLVEWSVENYVQLARLRQPPYGDRALVTKESGSFVGLVGFAPTLVPLGQLPSFGRSEGARFTPEVGLFWAVAPGSQRQGFATEAGRAMLDFAFQHLHLERVIATTKRTNVASVGVMRRLGMKVEENPYREPSWFQVCGIATWGGHSTGKRSSSVASARVTSAGEAAYGPE